MIYDFFLVMVKHKFHSPRIRINHTIRNITEYNKEAISGWIYRPILVALYYYIPL